MAADAGDGTLLSSEANQQRLKQRKKRKITSCLPCRDRKVACSKTQPCKTCTERGHPDLCIYERSLPQNERALGNDPSPVGHRGLSTSSGLRRPHTSTPPSVAPSLVANDTLLGPGTSPIINRTPFLGEHAIPSFVRAQVRGTSSGGRRENVEAGLFPILGIWDTAENLSAESSSIAMPGPDKIHEGLPSDREIITLFQNFKTQLQSYTPILSDVNRLEKQICAFVDQRSGNPGHASNKLSLVWLSLLYAILASGNQFRDTSHVERASDSNRFLRYSFQCLSYADYLMHPTIECLEALLVLGNVLQNLMRPQAAWILLGTTSRIAQSLGLHHTAKVDGPLSRDKKLWLSVIWADSLLSICFDRLPTTTDLCNLPFLATSSGMTYVEAMHVLIAASRRSFSFKSDSDLNCEGILEIISDISDIYGRSELHLRSAEDCDTIQQRCEHYALQLHTSFVAGWLSTRAFRRTEAARYQNQVRAELAATGKQYLTRSLEAYLKLCPISLQASRSWAFIHNGLSSALVLGLIGETKTNAEVRRLQGALIDVLSEGLNDSSTDRGMNGAVFLSPHHERALVALKNLYNEQVSGPVERSPNENFSAMPPIIPPANLMSAPGSGEQVTQQLPEQALNPTAFTDFSNMDPMEMFDSIIWDSNFGFDSFPKTDTEGQSWMF
ncbi:uncharacterized protein PAC_04199 [Phialocephala subalpina]|uniref:Zn(2)-C6 fungal-type domain-containing protein n=1 Tax=Phialocephala subalpina TaxID=576137 RepID=A0A1L7WNG6_9HELO|nr:uncharacterized protein PAC_04199 [Phialocephala subalpina]